jgi:hypothetical protein
MCLYHVEYGGRSASATVRTTQVETDAFGRVTDYRLAAFSQLIPAPVDQAAYTKLSSQLRSSYERSLLSIRLAIDLFGLMEMPSATVQRLH